VDAERRRAQRYRLVVPVRLQKARGVTRDISTAGVFFETEGVQSIGDTVRFSVDFPDATVQCEGRVVRVEKLEKKFGIAVEFTTYRFN